MKLIGVTADNEIVDVVLADCPSCVSKYNLAHLARDNSPLIRIDSIVYFDEENDLCEGDYLYINDKRTGYVYYSAGWCVHQFNNENKKLSDCEHISMKPSRRSYDIFRSINRVDGRKAIKICTLGEEMGFDSMIMSAGDEIILNGKAKSALRSEIFLSTGIYDKDKVALCFGGYYDGGTVCIDADYDIAVKLFDGQTKKLNLEEI